jgi:hypothetical protein
MIEIKEKKKGKITLNTNTLQMWQFLILTQNKSSKVIA